MATQQWKDFKKTIGKGLTDNVRANEHLSPLYFLIVVATLYFDAKLTIENSVIYGGISTLIYLFSSNYFQPDLDQPRNRPGMGHFPFGRWVGAFAFGRVLKFFAWPINRAWYYLWHPYGRIFTHRGLGHWPILGVYLRIGYLQIMFFLIYNFMDYFNYGHVIAPVSYYLQMFWPWSPQFWTIQWFVFCFPVFLSDFFHSAVDYRDSFRKGSPFCSPSIPRGLLSKTVLIFKELLKK